MELRESDRLGSRLLAINLRLVELDHEVRRTRVQLMRLESEMENARLAQLMGDEAADPAGLAPELERLRGSVESQEEFINSVKKHQRKAQVDHVVARVRERRAAREAIQAVEAAGRPPGSNHDA